MTRNTEYSEEMATKIDRQVRSIVFNCYEEARRLIRENRALIHRLVDTLLDQETVEGDHFRQIVAEYIDQPVAIASRS